MNDTAASYLSRRSLLRGLTGGMIATTATAITSPAWANIFFRPSQQKADIRRLHLYASQTGESINTVYWIDGAYIPEALSEISYVMRDWRNDGVTPIDPRTIDIMAAVHQMLDVNTPYTLLSGYRTAETNAKLRRRSRNVAKNSLHMQGQAADLRLDKTNARLIARAARACQAGGVGQYSRSNFVHMDCGPVRRWSL